MESFFTLEQLDQLRAYREQIRGSGSTQGAAVEAYQYLLGLISEPNSSGQLVPKAGVPTASWLWIKGAIDVNSGAVGFGQFIHNYTLEQAEIRGTTIDINQVSNAIALKVLEDIIDRQVVPPIKDIGENDALAATETAFGGNKAAWAGNLLFLVLGTNEFALQNLINGPDPGYDIAASLKAFGQAMGQTYDNLQSLAAGMLDIWRTIGANGSSLGTIQSIVAVLEQMEARLEALYGFDQNWLLAILDEGHLGTEDPDDNGVENGAFIHMGDGDDRYDVVNKASVIDGGRGFDTIDIGHASVLNTLDVYSPATQGKGITVQKYNGKVDHIYNFEVVKLGTQKDMVRLHGSIQHDNEKNLLIDALAGADTIDAAGMTGPVTIDLAQGRVSAGNGLIEIRNFEHATGSNADRSS